MAIEYSDLDRVRALEPPRVPEILDRDLVASRWLERGTPEPTPDGDEIRDCFPKTHGRPVVELVVGLEPDAASRPLRAGVVLSGGQAPGGHNVIAGLFDGLNVLATGSRLYGFLGGPRGIFDARCRELDATTIAPFRNAGGFDMLGSGRDKIETDEQFDACLRTCETLQLDGLVVIGGDDSNTNAALLAERFVHRGHSTTVVGVPKTIDGDLKGGGIEVSFGFDSATKVYSELIGNIARDARSAGKYWHFIRLMGRSASHVTLECALMTRPNLALIAEEVEARGRTIDQIVVEIAALIEERAAQGRFHGVVLVPEGLVEFVPEMRDLISELNRVLAADAELAATAATSPAGEQRLVEHLTERSARLFGALPQKIRRQLLFDRDAHGNVQVSRIDTESLLIGLVGARLDSSRAAGRYTARFQALGHFFGYEGRAVQPTRFDSNYTAALGRVAAALIRQRRTGYLCGLRGLAGAPETWTPIGVPLTSLMRMETRKGKRVPVVTRALVALNREPFLNFARMRESWAATDHYLFPGPIQFFGPSEIADAPTVSLRLEYPVPAE